MISPGYNSGIMTVLKSFHNGALFFKRDEISVALKNYIVKGAHYIHHREEREGGREEDESSRDSWTRNDTAALGEFISFFFSVVMALECWRCGERRQKEGRARREQQVFHANWVIVILSFIIHKADWIIKLMNNNGNDSEVRCDARWMCVFGLIHFFYAPFIAVFE